MSGELLIEIGTEEIPARFSPLAIEQMQELMEKQLCFHRIKHGPIHSLCTPRRLAICVQDVAQKQTDQVIRAVGPPIRIAYDKAGELTRAAIGFAHNQGVAVEDLKTEEIHDKGKYLVVEKEDLGKETYQLLTLIIPEWIASLGFPKSMRWGEGELRFARPIHWILAIFDGEVVPFDLDGIKSSAKTYGHRFIHPGPIQVKDFRSYVDFLERACVVCDPKARRQSILAQSRIQAQKAGGKLKEDEGLLEEVTHLVEWPVALCGSFDPTYLDLPEDVLITSMRDNQKYFCVVDETGRLLPRFITISNTPTDNPQIIVKGNERVLRARLSDAAFFLAEDTKAPFSQRLQSLKDVVFLEQLGSLYDKTIRIKELACFLVENLEGPRFDSAQKQGLIGVVERAGLLCKCDLVTEMVGEFPELQGIMGREYAKRSGEPEEVAQAIYEHYLPRFAGDDLPVTLPGALLSLADKMDNLAGCFLMDLIPTGSEDPHALRRQVQGMIQIVLDQGLIFPWQEFVSKGISAFQSHCPEGFEQAATKIHPFLIQRLNNYFLAQGFDYDLINAVLGAGDAHPVFLQKRLEALKGFRSQEAFQAILTPFKRVINILPKGNQEILQIDSRLFSEGAECKLYERFKELEGELKDRIARAEYLEALQAMVGLKEPIDLFFDQVLVMDKNEVLRKNRLALLSSIGQVFLKVADFSKIVPE